MKLLSEYSLQCKRSLNLNRAAICKQPLLVVESEVWRVLYAIAVTTTHFVHENICCRNWSLVANDNYDVAISRRRRTGDAHHPIK